MRVHDLIRYSLFTLCLMLMSFKILSWNALGHRIVAQIAYHQLTPSTKRLCNQYNRALNSPNKSLSFINAAPWLDRIPYWGVRAMKPLHYIDIPFSLDGTKLIPPNSVNALSAIEEAEQILISDSENDINKGLSLRILIHVIGDIHQPMHAVSQFSATYPQGDKGGNLIKLGANPIAPNLHSYWDRGGGLLLNKKAYEIEKRWPCDSENMELDPEKWVEESFEIAIREAYSTEANQRPDEYYENKVNLYTQQRIALAGCRLGALLNQLFSSQVDNKPHLL